MWSIGNEVLEQWSHADATELDLQAANLILNAGHAIDPALLKDTTLRPSILDHPSSGGYRETARYLPGRYRRL